MNIRSVSSKNLNERSFTRFIEKIHLSAARMAFCLICMKKLPISIIVNGTREKILETTFALLIRKGYDSVSISDIQKDLGISRGLLYCYFKNKSDLIIAACMRYFFDGYLTTIDLENVTLKEFISHIIDIHDSIARCGNTRFDILKYNTLYSAVIMREPRFKKYALGEFAKAVSVIDNAKKRGEIKNLPTNFIGATMLSILGRTTYITETPGDEYVRRRIAEDLMRFYDLVRTDAPCGGQSGTSDKNSSHCGRRRGTIRKTNVRAPIKKEKRLRQA